MSDSDDWEAGLDSDNEKEEQKKEEEKKKAASKFDDEDKVDPVEIEKQKKAEAKKAAQEAQENGRIKTTKKVDYDKEWEERQKKLAGQATKPAVDTTGMSAAQKGLIMEQAAESNLADQLFADEAQVDTVSKIPLTNEKEYKAYGEKVSSVLYSGQFPVRIETFFKELSKDLPEHCDSKQIKKIADNFQQMYNQKLSEEKKSVKGKKKPQVKITSEKHEASRNNNMAMVADVMGAGEEDDYADAGEGFKREEENEYDFM